MKAFQQFSQTMTRCNRLVEAFVNRKNGNDDYLRFAIVLAVSAFEKYVKDAFLEHLVQFERIPSQNPKQRNEFDSFLQKAGVDHDLWKNCYLNRGKCPRPRRIIRNTVQRHLSTISIQKHDSISGLFKYYGLGNILQNASAKSDRVLIWKTIEKLISRRHQIAHASDCRAMGRLSEVRVDQVSRQLKALARFVGCMEEIIQNKFSRKKKPRTYTRKRNPISH